jgi:hypothetical protein
MENKLSVNVSAPRMIFGGKWGPSINASLVFRDDVAAGTSAAC